MLLIAGSALPPVASAGRLHRSDRREISHLFDRFVPAAVRRLDPLSASRMVTPELGAGTTRADWKRGEIPVYPYPAKGTSFHGWRVRYIVGRQVGIELFLHPRRGSNVGPIAFNVVVKHVRKRWLVDSFLPAAVYTPPKKGNRISAPVDLSPGAPGGPGTKRLGAIWFVLPLSLLGLAIVLALGLPVVRWQRERRAVRQL
jgi:hypothetical protein